MLTIDEIKDLINTLDESSINEFVYQKDGEKLKLSKQNDRSNVGVSNNQLKNETQVVKEQSIERSVTIDDNNDEPKDKRYDYTITSPMVGTFYLSSSPDSDPYVSVGEPITKDTTVCMVEAMKLFNEIEAEVDGIIVEILAENGELVEYGQPLFGVKRN
ncbi:acetyl-CoA carboxylase biotin carboxyl carrier protein [Amphibacillus sp. MSJ-3]|uniref:acetyl-CoA carboxylase biotin carboxyl carrier protein n=1 Tax=Amphibacillus sp. MSJ-3 TaxID=2841505 RepID=UPI001C0F1ADA|nr:acetyl-CoA carboxylase biotin carboxyl carrier protein [Amphibacillus sp. MSJ-3]MBU5594800.1 acetyl-CoA carboxylase biotin carboxyl carrier protein [Amphibacillus sp. MSJ-3]